MPSPAFACVVLTITMVTGVLGLDQVLHHWDPKSPTRAWKLCSGVTQAKFLLLVLYFFAFLPAIVILFCAWLVNRSHLNLQLLLELSLLNGLSVEAILLSRSLSIPCELLIPRILVSTLASITGSLLVVGLGVSFLNNTIGRYVAFAGGRVFHVSAATVFLYILQFRIARRQKLICFSVTYTFAALGGFLFLLISNGPMFLLANCMLGYLVNFILLALAQIECHTEVDVESRSAGLSLNSLSPSTEETDADHVERDGSRQIQVEQTVSVTVQQYDLFTPPPTPTTDAARLSS